MIKWLIHKYVSDDLSTNNAREKTIALSGIIGIFCNAFIFGIKLILGLSIGSIAIITDAFNNLSDIGSSVISIVTAKLSNLPPDEEHPHGHGRYEYIGSLVVAFIVGTVGFELLKQSYEKIINPEIVVFNIWVLVLLGLTILIKLWMYSYNMTIYKQINSNINKATAYDSLSDTVGTSLVIFAMILGIYTELPVDGVMGVIIAVIIMRTGFNIAKETLRLLIGSVPDIEVQNQIRAIVNRGEIVLESHDLKIHDYGPGRVNASIHVEVPDSINIVEAHSYIDRLEKEVKDETNVDITIHIDPVSTDKAKVDLTHNQVEIAIDSIEDDYSIKNFRIAQSQKKLIVIFDLIVPSTTNIHEFSGIKHKVEDLLNSLYPHYDVVIDNVLHEEIK